MGYTTCRRPWGVKGKDLFRAYWESDGEERRVRILADALVNLREYYAVVESLDKKTGEAKVFGMANRVHIDRDEYGTRCGDTEDCGPTLDSCPLSLIETLDRLAPLDESNDPRGHARGWRARCRAKGESAANGSKILRPGRVVVFDSAMKFRGCSLARTFTYVGNLGRKRGVWRAHPEDGGGTFLCRLGKEWHLKPHRVEISAQERLDELIGGKRRRRAKTAETQGT